MGKVLFYMPFIKMGGIERVSLAYLEGLIKKGFQVDLIIDFNMGKDGNTLEQELPKGIYFQYIKPASISSLIYYFRTLGKRYGVFNIIFYGLMVFFDFYYYHKTVKKIIEKGGYGFTLSIFQFLPSYLTQFKNIKHIIWLHLSVEHFFSGINRLFKGMFQKKLNKYDVVISITDAMSEQLLADFPLLSEEKIKRIYNPFDFDKCKEKSIAKETLDRKSTNLLNSNFICSVGRLDEHAKDFKTLICAYEILYRENKIKESLYIIGDGISRLNLELLVKEKGLDENILFLGEQMNIFIWMAKAKIFILSSKSEGFGLVLVEAMFVNTFVISSQCKTGPKEILQNGECGDLFEVGNANELATKIEYALANSDYRDKKIKKATKRIKEFEKERILNQLTELLTK